MAEPQTLLRSWTLKNFKSVEDATVDFAPLTVVVGANSSGKSSLLQSILMAVQATQSQTVGDRFPLNGSLVSLGGYRDVVTVGIRGAITIGGTFAPQIGRRTRSQRPEYGRTRMPTGHRRFPADSRVEEISWTLA